MMLNFNLEKWTHSKFEEVHVVEIPRDFVVLYTFNIDDVSELERKEAAQKVAESVLATLKQSV